MRRREAALPITNSQSQPTELDVQFEMLQTVSSDGSVKLYAPQLGQITIGGQVMDRIGGGAFITSGMEDGIGDTGRRLSVKAHYLLVPSKVQPELRK